MQQNEPLRSLRIATQATKTKDSLVPKSDVDPEPKEPVGTHTQRDTVVLGSSARARETTRVVENQAREHQSCSTFSSTDHFSEQCSW